MQTQKYQLIAFIVLSVFFMINANTVNARRMDRREHRQNARIANGEASGQLTRGETRKLAKEQGRIHRAEARAESDGVVTGREKAHIEHMQDRASKDIYRAKHNDKTQNSAPTNAVAPADTAAPADHQ